MYVNDISLIKFGNCVKKTICTKMDYKNCKCRGTYIQKGGYQTWLTMLTLPKVHNVNRFGF